jgi:hypothetical protein
MWSHFWRILELGSDPPREKRDEDSCQLALEAALLCGHHKPAEKEEGGLADLLVDDVTSGYNLHLLLDQVVTTQKTFNEDNLVVFVRVASLTTRHLRFIVILSHNKRI